MTVKRLASAGALPPVEMARSSSARRTIDGTAKGQCSTSSTAVHSTRSAVQIRPETWQQRPGIGGAERVDSAPVSRDHGKNAAPRETPKQVTYHAPRQEGHVTGCDEGQRVTCGGEADLHTGQRSEPARALAGDVSDSFEPDTAISDYEDLLAATCEHVSDTFDQGHPLDLEG